MCGIFGIVSDKSNGFSQEEMSALGASLLLTQMRGRDSTGLVFIDRSGDAGTLKTLGGPEVLLSHEKWPEVRGRIYTQGKAVIGHGRSATRGTVSIENAHPFIETKGEGKDKDHKIFLVHNGTLQHHQTLPGFHEHDVDSEWLARVIAKYGPEEALAKVNGAIATMWWDTELKKLFFFRNHERPLHFAISDGALYSASEYATIAYLKAKFDLKFSYDEIYQVSPRILCSISFDELAKMKKGGELQGTEIKKEYSSVGYYNPPREDWKNRYSDYVGRTMSSDYRDILNGVLKLVRWDDKNKRYSTWTRPHITEYVSEEYASPWEKDLVRMYKDKDAEGIIVKEFVGQHGEVQMIRVKVSSKDSIRGSLPEETEDDFPAVIKFQPGRKQKFRTKGFNKTIKHRAHYSQSHPNHLIEYENSIDGKLTLGATVYLEIHKVVSVGMASDGKALVKALGYKIDPSFTSDIEESYADFYFYSSVMTEEEIFKNGYFKGEIVSIRLLTSDEHNDSGAYVSVCVGNIQVLDVDDSIVEKKKEEVKNVTH